MKNSCPYCTSDDVDVWDIQQVSVGVEDHKSSCQSCGASWVAVVKYHIVARHDILDPKETEVMLDGNHS